MLNETMVLDLKRPEHREALKWACSYALQDPRRAEQYAAFPGPGDAADPLGIAACRAISSPSDSAALVRALLEGLGLALIRCSQEATGHQNVVIRLRDFLHTMVVPMSGVPALILRLLACTSKEEALAALREVGR